MEAVVSTIDPKTDVLTMRRVRKLLTQAGLGWDNDIEIVAVAREGLEVVACMGLAGRILKCSAVRPDHRGENLAGKLVTELTHYAVERGRTHLFLFTKPSNREVFEGVGFHMLAEVPRMVCVMENDPHGIESYVAQLAKHRVPGKEIAGIVLNANPFTLGHQHLVKTAAAECDHVHVFVVREDASLFAYDDRLALVRAGIAEIKDATKVTVHPGSDYIVSRATFPSYFLKDAADLNTAATGLDLQLFRNYIAPALGIRHRYVGTEPFSAITNLYNNEMHRWLEQEPSPQPTIEVHEVRRIGKDAGTPIISATEIRRLLAANRLGRIKELVPRPTYDLICEKYAKEN